MVIEKLNRFFVPMGALLSVVYPLGNAFGDDSKNTTSQNPLYRNPQLQVQEFRNQVQRTHLSDQKKLEEAHQGAAAAERNKLDTSNSVQERVGGPHKFFQNTITLRDKNSSFKEKVVALPGASKELLTHSPHVPRLQRASRDLMKAKENVATASQAAERSGKFSAQAGRVAKGPRK